MSGSWLSRLLGERWPVREKNKMNEVATCKLLQVLKYVSNTTNMWFHLQTHHHCEYAAIESQERARPVSSGSSTSAGSSRIQPI